MPIFLSHTGLLVVTFFFVLSIATEDLLRLKFDLSDTAIVAQQSAEGRNR